MQDIISSKTMREIKNVIDIDDLNDKIERAIFPAIEEAEIIIS